MKKVFIAALFLVILAGCDGVNKPADINTDKDIEKQTDLEQPEAETITEEEAKEIVENYIMGMKEYASDNGYHLEEIQTKVLRCPGCYEMSYQYRRRAPESADIAGVADVTVTLADWKITGVKYKSDADNKELLLDIQTEPLIGGQRDEHGCLGPAGYTWCEPKQKCLRTWEEPCVEEIEEELTVEIMRELFAQKYPDWDMDTMEITIDRQEGDHAAGGITQTGAIAGGGYFFAAKTTDGWVLVADGNGSIACEDIAPYNFPGSMIAECIDSDGNPVNRLE